MLNKEVRRRARCCGVRFVGRFSAERSAERRAEMPNDGLNESAERSASRKSVQRTLSGTRGSKSVSVRLEQRLTFKAVDELFDSRLSTYLKFKFGQDRRRFLRSSGCLSRPFGCLLRPSLTLEAVRLIHKTGAVVRTRLKPNTAEPQMSTSAAEHVQHFRQTIRCN